ncbi:hypothetical protein ACFLWA_05865 [Chloroflexota bacterium]
MAFSNVNSRERTLIAALGVVIVIALVGIGFLVVRLVNDGKDSDLTEGVEEAASGEEIAVPVPTFTLVAAASLEGLAETTPVAIASQPVAVAQEKGLAPGLPVIVANQPLQAGHRYQLEVTAADGSKAQVVGSWSQSASNAAGKVGVDVSEPFKGKTPLSVDLKPPVPNPTSWSFSASAGPESILAANPVLVITLWDVTGSE